MDEIFLPGPTIPVKQGAVEPSSMEEEEAAHRLQHLCTTSFPEVSAEVDRLLKVKDPEKEPYKSKYEAIRLLKDLKAQTTTLLRALEKEDGMVKPEACVPEAGGRKDEVDGTAGSGAPFRSRAMEEARDMVAMLSYRQGAVAFEVDDATSARDLLLEALPRLEADTWRHGEPLLDAFNTLGTIHCNWSEHKAAETYLLKAKDVYDFIMCSGSVSDESGKSGVVSSDTVRQEEEAASAQQSGTERQPAKDLLTGSERLGKLQSLYTTTTFCLAQVYVFLQNEDKSAVYCAETLSRQLKYRDTFQPVEWAQNCTQLSGFYVGKEQFSKALRCLAAATAVMQMREDQDEGKDVEANISIGRGKLHMACLMMSRDRKFEEDERAAMDADNNLNDPPLPAGTEPSPDQTTPTNGKKGNGEVVREERKAEENPADEREGTEYEFDFSSLKIEDEGMGEGAQKEGWVHDYPAAVVQFNKSLSMFKKALEYYVLDGFVNDHFKILMDISSLHKYLAFFEPLPQRKKAIQARRATRLEPMVTQLNPNAYPVIWKQLNYELGCIAREVMDNEVEGKGQPAKVMKAAKGAAAHYERFLASVNPNGEDEEFKYELVMAHFGLARVYQTCHSSMPPGSGGEEGVSYLQKSLDHYRSVLGYGEKFDLPSFKEQLELCKEMVELIPAKLDLDYAKMGLSPQERSRLPP